MPYIDHTDLTKMVKALIDDVERLKQNNAFYVTRLDTQAKNIAELQAKVSALQYKGQDD